MNKGMSREEFMGHVLMFCKNAYEVLEIQKKSNVVNFLPVNCEDKIKQIHNISGVLYRNTAIGVAYRSHLSQVESLSDVVLRRNRGEDLAKLLSLLQEFYKGLQSRTILNQYSVS